MIKGHLIAVLPTPVRWTIISWMSHGTTKQDAGGTTNWASTRHQLPPLWVDKVDAVEEDVRLIQLKSKMSYIQRLPLTRLLRIATIFHPSEVIDDRHYQLSPLRLMIESRSQHLHVLILQVYKWNMYL